MSALSTVTWTGLLARPSHTRVPLLHRLRNWRRRAQDRAEIAYLDERILRDIGLSSVEIGAGSSATFGPTERFPLYLEPAARTATATTRK